MLRVSSATPVAEEDNLSASLNPVRGPSRQCSHWTGKGPLRCESDGQMFIEFRLERVLV